MLLNLMQGRDFDIRKFAESLEKNAQEGVKWERRKLEWILEEQQQVSEGSEKQEAA